MLHPARVWLFWAPELSRQHVRIIGWKIHSEMVFWTQVFSKLSWIVQCPFVDLTARDMWIARQTGLTPCHDNLIVLMAMLDLGAKSSRKQVVQSSSQQLTMHSAASEVSRSAVHHVHAASMSKQCHHADIQIAPKQLKCPVVSRKQTNHRMIECSNVRSKLLVTYMSHIYIYIFWWHIRVNCMYSILRHMQNLLGIFTFWSMFKNHSTQSHFPLGTMLHQNITFWHPNVML